MRVHVKETHPVNDFVVVKCLECLTNLNENRPYGFFREVLTTTVGALKLLEEVTITHELRHLRKMESTQNRRRNMGEVRRK